MLHGEPRDNNEVAIHKSTLHPWIWALGRDFERKKRVLGFNAPKPILELGLMIVGPIKYKCDFYTLLG